MSTKTAMKAETTKTEAKSVKKTVKLTELPGEAQSIDTLPAIVRKGHRGPDKVGTQIRELLTSMKPVKLPVPIEDADNDDVIRRALNSRIRSAAQSLGMRVSVINEVDGVSFQGKTKE